MSTRSVVVNSHPDVLLYNDPVYSFNFNACCLWASTRPSSVFVVVGQFNSKRNNPSSTNDGGTNEMKTCSFSIAFCSEKPALGFEN